MASKSPLLRIIAHLRGAPGRLHLHGLRGAGPAFVVASVLRDLPVPFLWVAPTVAAADAVSRDLSFFLGPDDRTRVVRFPDWDVVPYKGYSPSAEVGRRRIEVLARLAAPPPGPPPIVVAPVKALLKRLLPPEVLAATVESVRVGDLLDRDGLLERLVERGYLATDLVTEPGTYSVRGGILDVYTPGYEAPLRIELWGDEIDSLRLFDPWSQRSIRPLESARLLPIREEIVNDAVLAGVPLRLKAIADAREQPPRARIRLQEELTTQRVVQEIELLLPLLAPTLSRFVDYLPPDAIVIREDPTAIEAELIGSMEQLENRWAAEKGRERLLPEPPALFLHEKRLEDLLAERRGIDLPLLHDAEAEADGRLLRIDAPDHGGLRVEILAARDGGPSATMLEPLLKRLRAWRSEGRTIVLGTRRQGHRDQLVEALAEAGIPTAEVSAEIGPELLDEADLEDTTGAPVLIATSDPARGILLPSPGPALVPAAAIFGPPKAPVHRPRRRRGGPRISSFAQLQRGDIVVHEFHGIGRYRGLEKLSLSASATEVLKDLRDRAANPDYVPGSAGVAGTGRGSNNDYLLLEYRGGDRLYLPVHKLDLLSRYTAAEGRKDPPLDRLGGKTWQKRRAKVAAAVQKMARELLELYARRSVAQSDAYGPTDVLYDEFCAGFPYQTTPDQQSAIDAVMTDMSAPHPMDRLVCGDVGFGKTEVAMRAAFRAVEDGRQVAILVPTTILALQHFRAFQERMEAFPIHIEMVSRFRTAKQITAIRKELAAGRVDIVIGTHRLLNKDFRFKRLGLLVVDEEHRFGVGHKERIKTMRAEVDVLTMTATPIPRTLHMALSGIRDFSIITTPPQGRKPVRTQLARFSPRRIQDAIRAEVERGGQVYFVHNRVRTIHRMGEWLQKMLPGVSIRVGHGQMPERALENLMIDFFRQRFDVLVCSTIIESGIDVETANTILINRADAFGLAQLHQLRGRVGRSDVEGRCILLVPPGRALRAVALQRLKVIQDNTDLGSGHRIARHDLEIRGTGNLLGRKQSGHIADVGLSTYMALLEEGVKRLRGQASTDHFEPEVELRSDAYIPADWIEDERDRLGEYKQLADAESPEVLAERIRDLEDRYGRAPEEVRRFERLIACKVMCRDLRVQRLRLIRGGRLELTFDQGTSVDPGRLLGLVATRAGRMTFRPPGVLLVALDSAERERPVEAGIAVLSELAGITVDPSDPPVVSSRAPS
jgi:transcription-repair coupling factor (superfamily II helicase)